MTTRCPFCGNNPYEMVDVGVGLVPVAVNCCAHGNLLFDGRHAQPALLKIIQHAAKEIGDGTATEEQLTRLEDAVHAALDKIRMDWLTTKVVNVRDVALYGSRDRFWASPGDGRMEEEDGAPSDLRAKIDLEMSKYSEANALPVVGKGNRS